MVKQQHVPPERLAGQGRGQNKAPSGTAGKPVKRIVVTEGDVAIFNFINQYRLLRIPQLEKLTGRKYPRLVGRLTNLYQHGYLGRIRRPQQKDVYYIERQGLNVLLEHGFVSDEEAGRKIREASLKDEQFLEHELLLSDLHIMLWLATENSPIELVEWKEGKEIHDSFHSRNPKAGGLEEITIQPDAFFTLRDSRRPEGQNSKSFLLEADRATMPQKERTGSRRFNDKIRKYECFIREGRPQEVLGVPSVRILTVTLKAKRKENLATNAAEILSEIRFHKYFLFGSLADLDPNDSASLLGSVFLHPGDLDTTHPLIPPVA